MPFVLIKSVFPILANMFKHILGCLTDMFNTSNKESKATENQNTIAHLKDHRTMF